MTGERESLLAAEVQRLLTEQLEGPPCPACRRDHGHHDFGCALVDYVNAWKRINDAQAERLADVIWPVTE